MAEEIKKVGCYYRLSPTDDPKEDKIETQKDKCQTYCKKMGWKIVAEFEEPGHVSGKILISERTAAPEMFERIEKGEFDIILTSDDARLTRRDDFEEFGRIINAFKDSGTLPATPRQGVEDISSWMMRVMKMLKMAFSAKEREDILDRQQGGRYRASKEARYSAGQINYGLAWDDRNKKWRVDRDEYFVLKEIYRLIKAGSTTTEIARIFNADLYKFPPKYTDRWQAGNVTSKFKSDFLFTGERVFKTDENEHKPVKVIDPPFFTKEEVLEIRKLISRKRKPRTAKDPNAKRTEFLLAGLGKCICGGKLYVQDFAPSGRPHSYYRCRDEACKLRLNSKTVDNETWKIFLSIKDNPTAVKEAVLEEDFLDGKTRKDLVALRDGCAKRLDAVKKEMEKLTLRNVEGD